IRARVRESRARPRRSMLRRMASSRAAAAVLSLALVATGVAGAPAHADFGKDEKKFDNLAYPASLRARVHQAILRGSNWLLMRQHDDGSWGVRGGYPSGPTALAMLALVKSGIPVGHPKLERGWAYLRRQPLERTY